MSMKYKIGILGCGDFLRWMSNDILSSGQVAVKALFDPDTARAEKYASLLGGSAVKTADEIFNDPEISIVCLFVPPWIRKDMVLKAAAAGKHILATKPLGSNAEDCAEMVKAVGDKVKCGIIYRRTGNAMVETLKGIFDSGVIGKLAVYKQDWLHHYPEWNQWATDPKKNGGPFMDAMIHNLNIARYLMGSPVTACTYFSDNYAHALMCNDTEFMKLDFAVNGSAHLFITWAADLAVYSKDGNDREHIDIFYMITDQGWRVTEGAVDCKPSIIASRDGQTRHWEIKAPAGTQFDRFAASLAQGSALPSDIPDILEAYEDIKLLRDAEKNPERKFPVNLELI